MSDISATPVFLDQFPDETLGRQLFNITAEVAIEDDMGVDDAAVMTIRNQGDQIHWFGQWVSVEMSREGIPPSGEATIALAESLAVQLDRTVEKFKLLPENTEQWRASTAAFIRQIGFNQLG
jgi:hypothetical protein